MKLHEHLREIPLLRVIGEPAGDAPVSLIILAHDLRHLPEWLKKRPSLKIAHIFIADLKETTPVAINFPKAHGDPEVHCGLKDIPAAKDARFIFFWPREWLVRAICMCFPVLTAGKIWLAGDMDAALKKRRPLADFYDNNSEKLEAAYAILATDAARAAFAHRVKALLSGDPGYLPIAGHAEYEHPFIRPEAGDCMIDGGVSDMTDAQAGFARAVGEKGAVYGFEPIPWMAEKAAAQLACFPQYHLAAAGLAEKSGVAEFTDLRDSSRLGALPGASVVECRLTSIDSFVRANGIEKIDCIKLDIEGAELSALRGAKETILRDKPKLIICLYHKPRDIFEIPLYIHELAPAYRLDVAHSSAGFTDTILYASPK